MKKQEQQSAIVVQLLLAELSACRHEMIRLRKMLNDMIEVAKELRRNEPVH